MDKTYPVLEFHQFGTGGNNDRLLLFAAKAKDLASWAGIPRKGWRIRMLYQRWITPGREKELREFWKKASQPQAQDGGGVNPYVLGPSAIIVAMKGKPVISDGQISLVYESPVAGMEDQTQMLQVLAENVLPVVKDRLVTPEELGTFNAFCEAGVDKLPDVGHNYVLEFACQLQWMARDPESFISNNGMDADQVSQLLPSMEALIRPAAVVDGQHRLWGAQEVDGDVFLPVVAMTEANWSDQIYQFVVINEKAAKVDSELLSDIFASSLTPNEQGVMRSRFARVKVDIEQRIAGVLAGRDESSPFYGMVTLNLPNPSATEANAYISQNIIQCLIEGGRGARGWRSDDEFYKTFIQPTYPDREEWDNWKEGRWRDYWFAFWSTVIDVFTPSAKKVKGKDFEIWSAEKQSNLTKGVGLKIFQRFYMETCISGMGSDADFELLKRVLGETQATKAIQERAQEKAIPASTEEFRMQLRDGFLNAFPVRFFTAAWDKSLDDNSGHEKLLFQMKDAMSRDSWRASGGGVFVAD